jgi:photosystem II stability/assembly factor-like uncharacterized protein
MERYNPTHKKCFLNHATQLLITTEMDSSPCPFPAGEGQPDTPINHLNQGEVPMTGRIEKIVFISSRSMNLPWVYSIVLLIITLAACNAVATPAAQSTVPAISAKMPTATSALIISTSTISSTAIEEIHSAITPAPTLTALPTLRSGQVLTLTNIHMSNEQNGWGIEAGKHIVHTTDGGHRWKDVTPPSCAYQDSGFFALDANTAWATPQDYYPESCPTLAHNATIWHTSDGGNTWQEQHVCLWVNQECDFNFNVPPEYYYPIVMRFVDAQHGWLLVTVAHVMFQDRYRIYHTTDSGTHWTPITDSGNVPWVMSATGLAFQDQQTGWFATSQIDGATDPSADWSISKSTDAGHTWMDFQLPKPNPLPETFTRNQVWCGTYGVNVIPPDALGVTIKCKVYTKPLSLYDFYFHSPDGGKHWNSWLKTGDVDFIDALVGWRSTLNNITYDLEQTRDGGQTWTKLKTVQWNGDLEFVNEGTGWAIATTGNTVALVHTTDGGKTWEEIKPVVIAP